MSGASPELVSCILATGNRAAFVRQAIRCFLRQTYQRSELIVMDDGAEPVAGLCSVSPRIRYFRLPERTPVAAKLNAGVEHAQGAIIQKLDDDDYYAPDFLERAVDGLSSGDPARTIVAWDCYLVLLPGQTTLRHSGHGWAAGGTLCFRPELWQRQHFRDVPGQVDLCFLRDHQPNLVRICAPESYVLVRHGRNTWTKLGSETVDQYFQRQPAYHKSLTELVGPEDLPFYLSLSQDSAASGSSSECAPASVSVVIPSLNEGDLLCRTVDSLQATLPARSEIIVVDDGSVDHSTDFLEGGRQGVTLLRTTERMGAAKARNFGAAHARGSVLVFSDAHVATPPGWADPLLKLLERPEIGAVAPAIGMMKPAPTGSTGYGMKWRDSTLDRAWLSRASPEPYAVPLLCSCFLGIRRDIFYAVGEFDPGMIVWGSEEDELCLRLWTLGYECWVEPGVEVEHYFRARHPYEVPWEPVLYNKLRLATVHFSPERLALVEERLSRFPGFQAARERLAASDVQARASKVRSLRRYDDAWFFSKFNQELRSDLCDPGLASPVCVSPPRASVSACLLSWQRPQNLPLIVQALRQVECIDEILIWNNNPAVHLQFSDSQTRVIESNENQSRYGRFLCAAQARNPVVYVQDDDAINHDVAGLYRHFLADPTRIVHALSPPHWTRRHRRIYGDAEAALLGWGAFFRKEWLSVLDEVPVAIRADELFRREADIFFTLLFKGKHHPIPGDIVHLDGHCNPEMALWLDPRHRQFMALAIRQALRLLRLRKDPVPPVPWNVIIPCHNQGRYLRDAVDSVLANDADYEIHIVDDASTDETSEVAADLVERHPHIHYRRNEDRRGPGYSRNRGIAALESDFAVLLDADDKIGTDYLYEAAQTLSRGADVVNPDATLFGAGQGRWIVPDETTLAMLLQRNPVHYCSAFRWGLWWQTGGIDERMPHWMDYEFWIRLAAAGARIQGLHGDHFFHRQHANSRPQFNAAAQDELHRYIRQKHAQLFESCGG
jgi:glycosyltransferase involved in cell wall biosynthesis